jgi:NDP-sugar pyrophosphorylase family protein
MKAVLLAAGKGTRLKPLTDTLPKVMIPINGKPILEYHLQQLAKAQITDIFINLHHLPKKINEYFEDGIKWKIKIQYSYEPEILGTAGAVKKLEKELGDEPFLVVYGDNFLEINYKDFITYAEKRNGIGTIAVFKKEDVRECGILDIGYRQKVLHFVEKPKSSEVFSHWVNAGVYYFRNKIFNFIRPDHSDFGIAVFPRVLKEGETLYAFKLTQEVWGIDSIELLNQLRKRKGGQYDNHKDTF